MDLSRLKWPLIIIVVVGVGWLLTDGGVRYLRAKFTEGEVGVDPKQDEFNEAGLTNLAGFLIKTFRYAPAEQVLLDAMERYPEGKNFLYNKYRLAKCVEKQGRFENASNTWRRSATWTRTSTTIACPKIDVLNLRIDKLAETHELGEVGQR